jgi:hypothetical protein
VRKGPKVALLPGLVCKMINIYLNSVINYNLAWHFKSLRTLIMRSNWRGKSTTCTWCHWINLIWTMRPSRYFKYLLPQLSTLLSILLFIIQLCHITNGLMSPEDVSQNNFDKNIVNTWLPQCTLLVLIDIGYLDMFDQNWSFLHKKWRFSWSIFKYRFQKLKMWKS